MTVRQIAPVMFSTMLFACGGGDDNGADNSGPGQSDNGLSFAVAGQSLQQAEGVELTLKSAGFRSLENPEIGTDRITLGAGFTSNSTNTGSGTFRIFGEDVVITNGEGTLLNGQTVTVNFEPSRSGTYAGAVEVVSYGSVQPGVVNPLDGEVHTVFGFETSPTAIIRFGVNAGSVIYDGDFQAAGLVRDASGTILGAADGTELEGSVRMEVDFEASRVEGRINGEYNTGAGPVPVDLRLAATSLDDNGFSGALTCASDCTSGSSVDATFYGPAAEELGGVVAFDLTQNADDEEFQGVGSFVINTDAP